jgi:hypothetical protein
MLASCNKTNSPFFKAWLKKRIRSVVAVMSYSQAKRMTSWQSTLLIRKSLDDI